MFRLHFYAFSFKKLPFDNNSCKISDKIADFQVNIFALYFKVIALVY